MGTTFKIAYLRFLQRIGKTSLIAESVFGFPYRISLGDTFSENPFYNPYSNVGEVLATAAWVCDEKRPVLYDIGGHCGFVASQLAQLLKDNDPIIYSFEPVAPTFSDLMHTVNDLSLQHYIHPVAVALSDDVGFVKLNYSKWNSMLAQVIPEGETSNQRSGSEIYIASSQQLDAFLPVSGHPHVIKIDVEGWEVHVLKGAATMWGQQTHQYTGICLEWNPQALMDTGSSIQEFYKFFIDYRFFYLNDYEGQRLPELHEVTNPSEIKHVCNMFAVHKTSLQVSRWKENYEKLKNQYRVRVG